jgi:hypothetical protein
VKNRRSHLRLLPSIPSAKHKPWFAALLWALAPTYLSGQSVDQTLYLLLERSSDRWCAYTNEQSWNTDRSEGQSRSVAALKYSGDKLKQITYVSVADDWVQYDTYSVDSSGEFVGVERIIDQIAGT